MSLVRGALKVVFEFAPLITRRIRVDQIITFQIELDITTSQLTIWRGDGTITPDPIPGLALPDMPWQLGYFRRGPAGSGVNGLTLGPRD
jgi:hypothetical protein